MCVCGCNDISLDGNHQQLLATGVHMPLKHLVLANRWCYIYISTHMWIYEYVYAYDTD